MLERKGKITIIIQLNIIKSPKLDKNKMNGTKRDETKRAKRALFSLWSLLYNTGTIYYFKEIYQQKSLL